MSFRYMLDTNVISDLIKNPHGMVARKLEVAGEATVCCSIVVAAQLRYGAAKSGSKALHERVSAALSAIEVAPLDEPMDIEYGRLRDDLARKGKLIGPNDLPIAAHALSAGLSLVTDNVDEFQRVPGLMCRSSDFT